MITAGSTTTPRSMAMHGCMAMHQYGLMPKYMAKPAYMTMQLCMAMPKYMVTLRYMTMQLCMAMPKYVVMQKSSATPKSSATLWYGVNPKYVVIPI
nr:MAG TPA: hypothetical protein [Caudoviricetes sp.]